MLIPKDADFHVAKRWRPWAFGQGKQTKLADVFKKPESQTPHESFEKDCELWSKLDELRKRDLIRIDPVACSNFEHDLIRLEELSQGGEAYAEDASKLRTEVDERLSKAIERRTSVRPADAVRRIILGSQPMRRGCASRMWGLRCPYLNILVCATQNSLVKFSRCGTA